jgi:hypothetical protein
MRVLQADPRRMRDSRTEAVLDRLRRQWTGCKDCEISFVIGL